MRGAPLVLTDYSGGVDLSAAPYLLEENRARNLLNIQTNPLGHIRKRQGFETLTSLAGSPASFTGAAHSLGLSNGATKYLVAVGPITGPNDRPVAVQTDGTIAADLTRTGGGGAYTTNSLWSIIEAPVTSDAKGPIFAMNGVDAPQWWAGTSGTNFENWTAASGTIPATGKYLTYHANRLWCRDSVAEPSRVRYSGITGTSPDSGNWDADGYVDLEPEDGQEITAIAPFGSYLIVFKPRKTFVIYDLITGANRQISDTVGCIAHRSCVDTPSGLFFLDEEQGVMLTDGNTIRKVSGPIDPLIRQATLYPATLHSAAGVYSDDRYFLSLSVNGSVNDTTVEYDLEQDSWWIHDCASNQFALVDPVGTPKLFSASPVSAARGLERAFAPNIFEDAGAAYAGGAFWQGAHHVFGKPHVRTRVRQVRIDGTGNWDLYYSTDYADDETTDAGEIWSSSQAPTGVLFAPSTSGGDIFAPSSPDGAMFAPGGDQATVTERHYYTLGVSRSWSMKFYNNDSSDFGIYSMTIATTERTD